MADPKGPDGRFQRLVEYFQGSRFQFLALDYAGHSLRLSREERPSAGSAHRDVREGAAAAVTSGVATVLAASVGFVDLPPGRNRFPEAGESVAAGDCLFVIRRFRSEIEVRAGAAGLLASVMIGKGAFVEFGQPLATIA